MDKPTPHPSSNNQPGRKLNNWLAYTGLAFEMFATIGIFTVLGYFSDKKLDTSPFLLIAFLLTGFIVAFYRIFKQLK